MAWSVSGPERERRQAQVLASAKRRTLAQDNAGPVRGFGRQEEGQLFQGTVSAPQEPPWPAESDLRRGRCNAHDHLPHAQGRHPVSGSWRPSFRSTPPEAKARHLVAQLTKLGYTVQLQPLAEAA